MLPLLQDMEQIDTVKCINAPGTLDGGDVLKVGNTIYVGQSKRTNQEGIAQFAEILKSFGVIVVPVPLTKVLHLKSAATALPCGTIIAWADALDDEAVKIFTKNGTKRLIFAPEENGSHVVVLDERNVLMSHDAPQTIKILARPPFNLNVSTVDIDEYIKLEGCVTCLSVRIR